MKNVMLCLTLLTMACGEKDEDTATDVVVEQTDTATAE